MRQYNELLPTKDEIDKYIKKLGVYQRIHKGGVAFQLLISNNGTAKATDIRVFVDFPEEFLLFDISNIEDIDEPEEPKLPDNPIEMAEEEYVKQMNPAITAAINWGRSFNLNQLGISALPSFKLKESYARSMNLSLDIEEHSIIAETQQIPHRDLRSFDGIYIVPTKQGRFKAKISIMCSEYLEPIESYIDIEVL